MRAAWTFLTIAAVLAGCAQAPLPGAAAPEAPTFDMPATIEGACDGVLPRIAMLPGGDVSMGPLRFDGGRALVATHDEKAGTIGVLSVELATGKILWTREIPSGPTYQAVEGNAHAILVKATEPIAFHALDPATGETRWSRSDRTSGALVGPRVIFEERSVFEGVDARTGQHRWTIASRGGDASSGADSFYLLLREGAARSLEAYSLDDGAPQWSVDPGSDTAIARSTAELMLLGPDRSVRLDPATGRERWIMPGDFLTQFAFDGGRVHVASTEGLRVLDDATGREIWRASVPASKSELPTFEGSEVLTRPPWVQPSGAGVLASFVGFEAERPASAARLMLLDAADGEARWTIDLARQATVRAGDAIRLVLSTDAELFALDATTGARLWSCDLPEGEHVLGSYAGVAYLATPAGLHRVP